MKSFLGNYYRFLAIFTGHTDHEGPWAVKSISKSQLPTNGLWGKFNKFVSRKFYFIYKSPWLVECDSNISVLLFYNSILPNLMVFSKNTILIAFYTRNLGIIICDVCLSIRQDVQAKYVGRWCSKLYVKFRLPRY